MKKTILDNYEQEIENNISKYKPASPAKRKKIEAIIQRANEKKNISLRVNSQDIDLLKLRAEHEGVPYQILISSILHKFVSEQLIDQKNIVKSIRLLKLAG